MLYGLFAWITIRAQEFPVAVVDTSTLPEGFSREPACIADTVCVSELLFLPADDFLAILQLVTQGLPPEYRNIRISDVMTQIVFVSVITDSNGDGHAGAEFLVEKTREGWSILRRGMYIADASLPVTAEDMQSLGEVRTNSN